MRLGVRRVRRQGKTPNEDRVGLMMLLPLPMLPMLLMLLLLFLLPMLLMRLLLMLRLDYLGGGFNMCSSIDHEPDVKEPKKP